MARCAQLVGGVDLACQTGVLRSAEFGVLAKTAGGEDNAAACAEIADLSAFLVREAVAVTGADTHDAMIVVDNEFEHLATGAENHAFCAGGFHERTDNAGTGSVVGEIGAGHRVTAQPGELGLEHCATLDDEIICVDGAFCDGLGEFDMVDAATGFQHVVYHGVDAVFDAFFFLKFAPCHGEKAAVDAGVAAEHAHFFHDHDVETLATSFDGCGQGGKAAADNQDVKFCVPFGGGQLRTNRRCLFACKTSTGTEQYSPRCHGAPAQEQFATRHRCCLELFIPRVRHIHTLL